MRDFDAFHTIWRLWLPSAWCKETLNLGMKTKATLTESVATALVSALPLHENNAMKEC